MKKWSILIMMAVLLACSTVWASGGSSEQGKIKMQNMIYGAEIDSKIAFYQKRLFLVDSESRILADIGMDAVKRVAFLKANRQNLINNMIVKEIAFTNTRMNAFLGKTMNSTNLTTMEAYSD